jgi:hypothetical protein
MVSSPVSRDSSSAPRITRPTTHLILVLALLCSIPAHAEQITEPVKQVDLAHGGGWTHLIDVLNPYAAFAYTYDSNILRLDDMTPSIGSRSDRYEELDVGFTSDIKDGQQQYLLDGEYSPHNYQSHSELNYQGGKFGAVWHWTAYPTLTGTAGLRYVRTLRDFANQLSPRRVKDVRSELRAFGSADMDVLQNWKWGVRGEYADISFDTTTTLDIKKGTAGTSMTYVSSAGNELGADLEVVHADYVNTNGSSYDQYTVGPTLTWKYSVRTQLTGLIGYQSRNYSGKGGPFRPERPSYSGPTFNFALTIADAGRGSLTATAYQELSNLTDEIPDYAVVDGVSLQPAWTLSWGMTVHLKGTYEHRDFKDPSGGTARRDDVGSFGGFLEWPVGRHFKLNGGGTAEKRSSSRPLQGYEYLLLQLQIVGTL